MHTGSSLLLDENGTIDQETNEFDITQEVLERFQRLTIRNQGKQLDKKFVKKREKFIANYDNFKEKINQQREFALNDAKRITSSIKVIVQEAVDEGKSGVQIFLYKTTMPSAIDNTSFHSLILVTEVLEYCKKNKLIGYIENKPTGILNCFYLRVSWL